MLKHRMVIPRITDGELMIAMGLHRSRQRQPLWLQVMCSRCLVHRRYEMKNGVLSSCCPACLHMKKIDHKNKYRDNAI